MTRLDEPTSETDEPPSERETARRRVEAKRDLGSHVAAYLVVNAVLVALWAATGAGYFWPIWVIAIWGAGLAMHAWDVYIRRPVTESDIDEELSHRGR